MADDNTVLGLSKAAAIAGAMGIATGIVFNQDGWRIAIVRAFAGASCVLFVAPAAIQWMGHYVDMTEQMCGLVFWAVGMFGIAIVTFLAKAARNPLAAVQEWLKLKQGGGPTP